LEALANKSDVAVGISTSGNSLNVLEGVKVAKQRGTLRWGKSLQSKLGEVLLMKKVEEPI